MMADPRAIATAIDYIWAARAFERIGDHTKNLCEYIVYLVKGKDVRHTSYENIPR
jgi:phosphate transport system protein